MSENRIIVVESPTRLSIDNGRLKITSETGDSRFVAPADLAALCIDSNAVLLTSAVLATLAANGAAILVSDSRHLPVSLTIPAYQNLASAKRLSQQFTLAAGGRAHELWREVVGAKLRMQAQVLRKLNLKGAVKLERLSGLPSGIDAHAAESQGARHYFANLFQDGFKREKEGAEDPINARLNYGYAVMRAMVARALAAAGMNLSLGLGHRNSENPMNLVDDFVEPYRPIVDYQVAITARHWEEPPEFRGREKKCILEVITRQVSMIGQMWRLPGAIAQTAHSFGRNLEGSTERLALPIGFS